jgi:glutamate synthase (ferredoxin)
MLFHGFNSLSKPFLCQVYENMEVKKRVALSNPYGNWIKENQRSLKSANFLSSSVMENDAVLRHQQ